MLPLLLGAIVSLFVVLGGSGRTRKIGAIALLLFLLLFAALFLVLGRATQTPF